MKDVLNTIANIYKNENYRWLVKTTTKVPELKPHG